MIHSVPAYLMAFARQLILILTIAFSVSLPASNWTSFCGSAFSRLRGWFSGSIDPARLRAVLSAELAQIRPGAEKFLGALPPGSRLKVNEGEYTVVAYLGDGYEGTVYLADGPLGRKVVKQFKGTTNILAHVNALNRLAEAGVRTPRVWEVDERNQRVLLDYVEGLAVAKVRSRGPQFGLTAAEMARFEARLAEFKRRVEPHWPRYVEQNVLLDFNSGEFVVIDPI